MYHSELILVLILLLQCSIALKTNNVISRTIHAISSSSCTANQKSVPTDHLVGPNYSFRSSYASIRYCTALHAKTKKKSGVPVLPEFSRILNVGQIPAKRPGMIMELFLSFLSFFSFFLFFLFFLLLLNLLHLIYFVNLNFTLMCIHLKLFN